jgi:hypothetical protein
MPTACARIVIMQRAAQRNLANAGMLIDPCMPKEFAKIAILASITRKKDKSNER